jgi:hypothetical protein
MLVAAPDPWLQWKKVKFPQFQVSILRIFVALLDQIVLRLALQYGDSRGTLTAPIDKTVHRIVSAIG